METEINLGRLKLCFEKGKVGLYWKELKLTKDIGLHSAFLFDEKLYVSSPAQWHFTKISDEKMHISINYKDICIMQSWILHFTGFDELSWEVDMQVNKPACIRQKKTGLFLSDNYFRWFNLADEGEFPKSFNWDDIPLRQHILLNPIDSRGFGVKPYGEYPGILFDINAEGLPLLQNTNEEIRGRTVQFELKDKEPEGHYEPGSYKWCSGKIKVIEDEKQINIYI